MASDEYTTQNAFGYFGARWACAVDTIAICFEHFRRTVMKVDQWKLTIDEIRNIAGRFLLDGDNGSDARCFVSNYKDHIPIFIGRKQPKGWARDPEAHYFIRDWPWVATQIGNAMHIDWLRFYGNRYGIMVIDTDGNPNNGSVRTHFEPLYMGNVIANPTPGLDGPEVERRAFPI